MESFGPPDILILDVDMPDIEGWDVCDYLRQSVTGADTTVVFLTGAEDEMTRTYLGPMSDYVGGDYYLRKPCDSRILLKLLKDIVQERQAAARRDRVPAGAACA